MDSFSKGSFSVCAADDLTKSETVSVAVLLNCEPVVNSRRVLAMDGVVGMS